MTDRLAGIEARLHAATEGPWAVEDDDGFGYKVYLDDHGFGTAYICEEIHQGDDVGKADAEFIAAARTDMAALLKAVQRTLLACDAMDAGVAIRSGDPRTKSHAASAIRAAIREALEGE
jgi:hypothetical protein